MGTALGTASPLASTESERARAGAAAGTEGALVEGRVVGGDAVAGAAPPGKCFL